MYVCRGHEGGEGEERKGGKRKGERERKSRESPSVFLQTHRYWT